MPLSKLTSLADGMGLPCLSEQSTQEFSLHHVRKDGNRDTIRVDEKGGMGFGALNSVDRILNMKEAGEIFTVSNIFEFHQGQESFSIAATQNIFPTSI